MKFIGVGEQVDDLQPFDAASFADALFDTERDDDRPVSYTHLDVYKRQELWEMKPAKYSPAHRSEGFAELICSNSLKAARLDSAAGLLKEEMRRFGSLLTECARKSQVPAGGALAVDREEFSRLATMEMERHPLIEIHRGEVTEIPRGPAVIATGPLTSEALSEQIQRLCGGSLCFFDAAAPIVTRESLDMEQCFAAVSYTHLDVYKRQGGECGKACKARG